MFLRLGSNEGTERMQSTFSLRLGTLGAQQAVTVMRQSRTGLNNVEVFIHTVPPARRMRLYCSAKRASSRPAAAAPDSVRPLPIRVITVGKGNSRGADLMAEEWEEKIKRYTQFQHHKIKPNPKKTSNHAIQKASEGEKVLRSLSSDDFVVVLDERGKMITSEGVAQMLTKACSRGARRITFCIGGPYGHSETVRGRSDETISLSSLVLNHQVAHIVLLEQIYRGWSILKGSGYHHA